MNKNIEDIIKEALENHDSGYVSGAWEQMQMRLDGTAPTPFYKKWWVAAAFGTVLVGSATYFMLNQQTTENKPTVAQSKTEQTTATTTDGNLSVSKPNTTTYSGNTATTTANPETTTNTNTNNPVSDPMIDQNGNYQHANPVVFPPKKVGNQGTPNNPATPASTPVKHEEYKHLSLPTTLCLNETLVVENPNDTKTIVLIEPSGRRVEIAPKKAMNFVAKRAGTITVQSGDHLDVITVNQNTDKIYVDVDPSLLFENGIPSLKFKAVGTKNNLTWESNIKGTETKNDMYVVHPYTERVVNVTVTSTNEFGCTVEEQQQVTINEPYNLLAPTGFFPQGNDERTNSFMPIALKERNVTFELVIIDPKNGGTVFSTSDASTGWNGIDKRTGELVNQGTVWPWKVVLRNPNVGEPKEYSGTITRM